jgi:hypothetical protein
VAQPKLSNRRTVIEFRASRLALSRMVVVEQLTETVSAGGWLRGRGAHMNRPATLTRGANSISNKG